MNPVIIPNIDPIPLPAPVWLLQSLLYLTFILHIFPMNLILGGGLVAVALAVLGRSPARGRYARLARQLAAVLPVAVAAAVTLGVAALLFLQVLYGPLYYTATVLIALPWISVIGLLIVGYYAYYYFGLRRSAGNTPPIWAGILASLVFLCIAFLYANMATLMIRPEKFAGMHGLGTHGILLNTNEPMLWPRYLHFIVGAIAVTSLLVMIVGLVQRRRDEDYGNWAVQLGGILFVAATVAQMIIGVWQLLMLRTDVMMRFLGEDTAAMLTLGGAIFLALAAIILILVAALGRARLGMTIAGIIALVGTIKLMVIVRGIVRTGYLGSNYVMADQPVRAQWLLIAIFFILLLAGLALVVWMLHAVIARRGMPSAPSQTTTPGSATGA